MTIADNAATAREMYARRATALAKIAGLVDHLALQMVELEQTSEAGRASLLIVLSATGKDTRSLDGALNNGHVQDWLTGAFHRLHLTRLPGAAHCGRYADGKSLLHHDAERTNSVLVQTARGVPELVDLLTPPA